MLVMRPYGNEIDMIETQDIRDHFDISVN